MGKAAEVSACTKVVILSHSLLSPHLKAKTKQPKALLAVQFRDLRAHLVREELHQLGAQRDAILRLPHLR